MKGIGVDAVDIEELRGMCGEALDTAFVRHTFTEAEVAQAKGRPDPAQFLAGRFACKEAAFKALAFRTAEGGFDFRIVETLHDEHGHPCIRPGDQLRAVMAEAGATELLASITNEGGLAIAFVVAQ